MYSKIFLAHSDFYLLLYPVQNFIDSVTYYSFFYIFTMEKSLVVGTIWQNDAEIGNMYGVFLSRVNTITTCTITFLDE